MWELEHKEGWVPNNWFFWTVVLEKTLESPLGSKEIKPVNQINQSWTLIGRTDAEAEAPILGPPYANCPLIGKYPDAGKDWGKEDKRETEDEIVGWYHQLNRHESEQTPGDWKHGSLVACSPWCCRVGHNWVNNNKKNLQLMKFTWEYVNYIPGRIYEKIYTWRLCCQKNELEESILQAIYIPKL